MNTPFPYSSSSHPISNALIAIAAIIVAGAISLTSYSIGHEQGHEQGQLAGEAIAHKAWVQREASRDDTQRAEMRKAKALGELEGMCTMARYDTSKEVCRVMIADIKRGK